MTDVRVPLAAKYRPGTFTDVAWQKPTRTVLYLTCKNGNVPPGMLFSGERGCGKLLRRSTPIPVPGGWTAIGDLQPGDVVFDESGNPTRVTAVFDEMPERAWKLTFSDGAVLIAGGEHQWVTWDRSARLALSRTGITAGAGYPENWPSWRSAKGRGPEIRTTDDIAASIRHGSRGDLNHAIPVSAPLQLPEQKLPVPPWMLGYWLGNGSALDGRVTTGSAVGGNSADEPAVRERCAQAGYATGPAQEDKFRSPSFTVYGLVLQLRQAGVLGSKHVPASYLRSSERQRRLLLAGLLDSDGHVKPGSGQVEFCSADERLAESVLELVRSLGEKPVLSKGRALLNGVDHGPKWRVHWRALENPFTLPRKQAAFRQPGAQTARVASRMIVSAEELPVEPMRCITVDSPHSLYLAGEGMIPTHNTTMARMVAKALNCTGSSRKAGQWPCNSCASCLAVDNETHMDVEELDAASNGTVDQAREIRERALVGPLGTGWKVFVIDEAHGLSAAAWKVFFKVLEEPPAGVLFIFCTTEPSKVPAPVHSRTSPFLFTPLPVTAIRDRLAWICEQEDFHPEPELLTALAESCRGGMRDAVVRLDQLASVGITSYSMWQQLTGETDFAPGLVSALAEGDMGVAYADMRSALSVYGSASRVADDLVDCLADVLTLTCGGEILRQGRPLEDRQALAAKLGPQRAHAAMAVLWDLETRVRADSREKSLTMALAVMARRMAPREPAAEPIRLEQPLGAASIREIMEHA